jgi:serine/threonine protein kinase
MPLGPGEVFATYTVERLLRTEYGGEEYLAAHPRLPRNDLLWVFPPDWSADGERVKRFAGEADRAAMLHHPHILGIRDRGEDAGQPWIVFEHVVGTDAAALIDQHPGGVPADHVVTIVSAIAEALEFAHERGVIHGGVAPARILTTDGDDRTRRILLTDFALSRLADGGASAGRVSAEAVFHSAPELLTDEPHDGRADQYALAATAFHLLTGTPPFTHTNPAVVISRHLTTAPPSLVGIRSDLAGFDAILERALAKDPGDRYPTCKEFGEQFAHAGAPAAPPRSPAPTTPAPRSTVAEAPTLDLPPPPIIQSTWGMPKPATAPRPPAKPAARPAKTAPLQQPPIKPKPKTPAAKITAPGRTEADFWTDVGIDPIRIVLGAETLFTLRCYVDDQAYFLGRRRTITAFTSRRGLIDYLAADDNHDLAELITFAAVVRAASSNSIALPVSPKNTFSLTGLAHAIEHSLDTIDTTRLEMVADLALDVGDYTGDSAIVDAARPERAVFQLVSAVVNDTLDKLPDRTRRMAVRDWHDLEERMLAHLWADVRQG